MNKSDVNIANFPRGGMNMDSYPTEMPLTDVRFRVNGGFGSKKYFHPGDVNDKSMAKWIEGMPENYVGSVTIAERGYWIIFSENDGASEIGMANWKDKKYTKIATDKEFGCDWGFGDCEEIRIEYDYLEGCKDLKVYFSSKTIYYNINIDELIDPKRKEGLLSLINSEVEGDECQKYDCTYFQNFKCVCGQKANLTEVGGGYNLPAGVYQVAVQFEDRAGTPSNIFTVSDQINIGSEDNIPGQRSDSSIEINLSNLPCHYHIVNIILSSKIGEVESSKVIARRVFTNRQMTYIYNGKNNEEYPISPTEIRYKGRVGFKGKDLIIRNNKMWYYNLLPKLNPNLQAKVIEQTQVRFRPVIVPYADVKKYGLQSGERLERYLYGVVYNTCEYGATPVFLFSPTGGGVTEYKGSLADVIKSKEVELSKTEFDNGEVVRLQADCKEGNLGNKHSGEGCGRGGNCGLCGGDGGGESRCGSGGCLGYRGQGGEGQDPSSGQDSTTFADKTEGNIESTSTSLDDTCDTIDCASKECCEENETCCDSNCDECQCEQDHKAAEECRQTYPGIKNTIIDWLDRIAAFSEDGYEPTTRSSSLKEAAINLMKKAVKKREQVYQNKDIYKVSRKATPPEIAKSPSPNSVPDDINIGDKTVDLEGNKIMNVDADWSLGEYGFKAYCTNNKYPDTLDCEGKPIYGKYAGKPLELFEYPSASRFPLFINKKGGEGVVSNNRPDGKEWGQDYVVLLVPDIQNLYIPTDEELGATLCKEKPFEIVMVERDFVNSRVQAKGILHGAFKGKVHGKDYLYSRHAVNSVEYVDRYIDNEGDRRGDSPVLDHFFFHSLDTNIYKMGLAPTHIYPELIYKGIGERYGLYAKGFEPENRFSGRRIDMRGARSATNLSHWEKLNDSEPLEIDGITYVAPDEITVSDKIDYPVMNRGREGIVVFKSEELEDVTSPILFDYSFLGVTIDHRIPANGRTLYVAIIRENPDQYGSVINQSYVPMGLEGNIKSLENGNITGIAGDVYVGYNTIRRTSYISDKVGEEYPIGEIVDGKQRSRTVCDPPDNWDYVEMGAWNPLKLPKSGDLADAKNWAGLRTYTKPFTFKEVTELDIDDEGFPNNQNGLNSHIPPRDSFYPGTLVHLNHFRAETKVCPWLRQTGEGLQAVTKKVFYPNLKDLELDSTLMGGSEENGVDWKMGWLNEYHIRVEQPSKAQLLKKFFLKQLINTILPVGEGLFIGSVETAYNVVATGLISVVLLAVWTYIKLNYFTDERINEMCGIPNCRTDIEGGNSDKWLEGFQDNYWKYNWDYSQKMKIQTYMGLPDPYYTCTCEDETVNYAMISGKKKEGIDAYLGINPFSKIEIPLHNGKLRKLFANDNGFFAQTNDRTLVLYEPPTSVTTVSGGQIRLGAGGQLREPRPIFEELPEGRWGVQDPNASIPTPWGQFFIDEEQRAIYLFSGRKAENLASEKYKMSRFFWENLPFKCKGCRDEKQEHGYSVGLDYERELIFLTKHDCECSWTMAFSIKGMFWYSFYDFAPKYYLWNKNALYLPEKTELWRLYAGEDNLKYFGKSVPYKIEIPIYKEIEKGVVGAFQYNATILDTVVQNGELLDRMESFNKVAIHGDLMSTGLKGIRVIDPNNQEEDTIEDRRYVKLHRSGTKFYMNEFRNNLDYDKVPVIKGCPYDEIAKIRENDDIPDDMYADYFMMRLIYEGNNELITKSVQHRVDLRTDG